RGDVVDRLRVVSAPRDRGVADADLRRRRRHRRVEAREIHRGIERRLEGRRGRAQPRQPCGCGGAESGEHGAACNHPHIRTRIGARSASRGGCRVEITWLNRAFTWLPAASKRAVESIVANCTWLKTL